MGADENTDERQSCFPIDYRIRLEPSSIIRVNKARSASLSCPATNASPLGKPLIYQHYFEYIAPDSPGERILDGHQAGNT